MIVNRARRPLGQYVGRFACRALLVRLASQIRNNASKLLALLSPTELVKMAVRARNLRGREWAQRERLIAREVQVKPAPLHRRESVETGSIDGVAPICFEPNLRAGAERVALSLPSVTLRLAPPAA